MTYNEPMRVNEAKAFLVHQTADQAQREGVPLSDLEKRMIYFTESEDATENPIELNEEFESQYNTTEYETKIARLLIHAYRRLKKEQPETARLWDEAIRELRKGDHYILVMWGQRFSVSFGFWKTLAASLILVLVLLALIALLDHYNIHWNR